MKRTQTDKINNSASEAVLIGRFCLCHRTPCLLVVFSNSDKWFAQILPSLTCSPLWSVGDIFKVAGLGFLPLVFTPLASCSDLEIQSFTDKNNIQNQNILIVDLVQGERRKTREPISCLLISSFPDQLLYLLQGPAQVPTHPERFFLIPCFLGFGLHLMASSVKMPITLYVGFLGSHLCQTVNNLGGWETETLSWISLSQNIFRANDRTNVQYMFIEVNKWSSPLKL